MGEPKDKRPLAASIETLRRRRPPSTYVSRSSGSLDCDPLRVRRPRQPFRLSLPFDSFHLHERRLRFSEYYRIEGGKNVARREESFHVIRHHFCRFE